MRQKKNDKKVISTDGRITNQDQYLFGAVFERKAYKAKSKEWEHDHCRFCWETFSEDPSIGKTEGYHTENRDSWVCEQCFNDFKDLLKFNLK